MQINMVEQAFKNIDEPRFRSQAEKHELWALYEEEIQRMGNAGRNGGDAESAKVLAAFKKLLVVEGGRL